MIRRRSPTEGAGLPPKRPPAATPPAGTARCRGISRAISPRDRPCDAGRRDARDPLEGLCAPGPLLREGIRADDRVAAAVLLDASASMTFHGAERESKLDVARRAAAGLAWLALAQGDEAGLTPAGAARATFRLSRSGPAGGVRRRARARSFPAATRIFRSRSRRRRDASSARRRDRDSDLLGDPRAR